jgi:UDP-N-acetylglucosamine 2-epimerase
VHPRTRSALEKPAIRSAIGKNVHLRPPLGYLEAVAAVRDAFAVVTDSGGIQREAYWLGTPCVTVRDETEWGETVELGANALLPPARAEEELPGLVRARAASRRPGWRRTAYGSGDAARKVAEAVAKWVDTAIDARKQHVS